ncbi:hypothetical protein Tco_0707206 [Tanacetum coccineum]|uniref:Reverse transcriptase Ty1/copia-type domain-containing protein n=1 Tax=Tanacetum coccineum TaxID=301880 RepID=A0ABQ4YBM2_9ASTR
MMRSRLHTDAEVFMYALTESTTKPKIIKEAMSAHSWIKSMQDELHQFQRLDLFLGLQVHKSPRGIFISQSQYAIELLKKQRMDECDSMSILMATARLDADLQGTLTD